MLDSKIKKKLMEIARDSIVYYLKTGKEMAVRDKDKALLETRGAFVTLHENGSLRGCIGSLVADHPLGVTIRDMAVEAATHDPRFPPVEPSELPVVEIEISVLSPLRRIDDPSQIELGRHGVLVRQGFSSGVFLPQVASETGWSREEFLSNLCAHKAGLPPAAWKDGSCELYIFTAEVFSEKEH